MKKIDTPVIVEQTFNTSVVNVWNAITELDQMKLWYFDNIPAFVPKVSFETQFNVVSGERNFLHKWKVAEVVEFQKITYRWRYEDYTGEAFVTFELFEENNYTILKLTTKVEENFQDDIPEFERESCVGGWEYFIKDRLKVYLEK